MSCQYCKVHHIKKARIQFKTKLKINQEMSQSQFLNDSCFDSINNHIQNSDGINYHNILYHILFRNDL